MADTFRTRPQLVSDLADNNTRAITEQVVRNLLYSTVVVASDGTLTYGGTNVGPVAKRTAVADANYTLLVGDSLVAYTSLTASRTVTANPATMTVGKIYTVVDETGKSEANQTKAITVSLASGKFMATAGVGGFNWTAAPIVMGGGSISFYTPDGVNVVVIANSVVRTATTVDNQGDPMQVMTIGNGVVPGDQSSAFLYASVALTVIGLNQNVSSVGGNLGVYVAGVNFPNADLVGTTIFDLNSFGGIIAPPLFDGGAALSIDPQSRYLYGTNGTTVLVAYGGDNAGLLNIEATKMGFFGTNAIVQPANTVGPATALRALGLIASAGTLYGDWTPAGTATQTANTALMGPTSGSAATPTFRAVVSADLPIGSQFLTAATTADRSTVSGTLVDVTDLSVALVAGATYEFEAHLSVNASAITGNQYGVNFSASGASVKAQVCGTLAANTMQAGIITALNTATATFDTAGADGGLWITGRITTTTNAGNLTIQHLAVVATTTTAKVYAGSSLTARRVA